MRKRYAGIESVLTASDGNLLITLDRDVHYLKEGNLITSNDSGITAKISRVESSKIIGINMDFGFTSGTSVIILSNVFDGETLGKRFPKHQRNDDFISFLNPYAEVLQEIYEKVRKIPEVIDVETCPDELLKYLATSRGIPIKETDTPEIQREVIKLAEFMYRNKSSKQGIVAAFQAKGYDAEILEYYTKKYAKEILSVSGTQIEFVNDGSPFPPLGQFFPIDIVAKSTGPGSLEPEKFDGTYALINSIQSPYEVTLKDNGLGLFSPGDWVVVYNYETARDTTDYPDASSFVNIKFTDRFSPPRAMTDEILQELSDYLRKFLSTHARLWNGTGIERIRELLADFREDGEFDLEGLEVEFDEVYEMSFDLLFDGTFKTYLDTNNSLDGGNYMDEVTWLTASVNIEFDEKNTASNEGIEVNETWTITT